MSLLNLGYGLGGFMQGYDQQQNQQLARQLSQLYQQNLRQQMLQQQQQQQAAGLLFPALLGGGTQTPMPGQPSVPQFGGGPFGGGQAPTPPAATQPSSPPSPPQLGGGPDLSSYGGAGVNFTGSPGAFIGSSNGGGPNISAYLPTQTNLPGLSGYDPNKPTGIVEDLTLPSGQASPTAPEPLPATAPSSPPGDGSGSSATAQAPLSAGDVTSVPPMHQMFPRGGMDRVLGLIEQDESGGRNIPNYLYDARHTAQGNFQITNTTWRETAPKAGVDLNQYPTAMSAPYPVQRAVAAKLLEERGTQPWADFNPKLAADLGGGRSGGGTGGGGAGLGAGGDSGTNAILQQAIGLIQKGMAPVPESLYGRMSTQQLARQIENANPGADPVVKMLALERGMKLLAPEDRLATQEYMREHQDLFREGLAILQSQLTQGRQVENQPWQVLTDPSTNQQYRYNPRSAQATTLTGEPYSPGGAQKLAGAGTTRPGHEANIIAFDKEGNQVFQGNAIYTPNGWVNTATGQQIPPAARVQEVSKSGEGSAGRAGAQTSRQLVSGREIMSDLQNVVDMPITSDRGIFGGRKQGPSLTDALKEDLATTITGEDAQLINSALAGLERELSIVVSPVYGGHWAADTFAPLSLKEGQTQLVKLYNLARMRQTVDNALESVENTDWVGGQQKKYAGYIREQLAKIVPWTPRDIIQFRSDPDEETFGSFVKKQGIGGAAGQPGAMPKVDANGNEVKP